MTDDSLAYAVLAARESKTFFSVPIYLGAA